MTDDTALDAEVAKHDLVISLIPYTFHATVIKSAIRNKKNVVTTSYVSPAMLELDAEAKAAGITVMNEIGLDPGIDHLYAIKTIDEVHKEGGKILSFLSYCGGLVGFFCLRVGIKQRLTLYESPPRRIRTTRSATSSRGRRAACCWPCAMRASGGTVAPSSRWPART